MQFITKAGSVIHSFINLAKIFKKKNPSDDIMSCHAPIHLIFNRGKKPSKKYSIIESEIHIHSNQNAVSITMNTKKKMISWFIFWDVCECGSNFHWINLNFWNWIRLTHTGRHSHTHIHTPTHSQFITLLLSLQTTCRWMKQ